VLVVVGVVSAKDDMDGLKAYSKRASELIGPLGGVVLAQGGTSVDGEACFGPLVIQRWSSEGAFRAWIGSDAYRPLNEIRLSSSTMRVAIVPISGGLNP